MQMHAKRASRIAERNVWGSHSGDHEEYHLFWDIKPCSRLKFTDVSDERVTYIFKVEE
jgi:hypothetical protein